MAIIRGKYSRIKLKTCFKLSTNATYDASSAISDPFNVHANPPTMLSAPILISTCSATSTYPLRWFALKVCFSVSLHPAPGRLSRWCCTQWRPIPVLTLGSFLDSCTRLQIFCQSNGIIPKVGLFECLYPAPDLPAG